MKNPQIVLGEATIACRAVVSASKTLKRYASDLKAESLFFKKLNQRLMRKALVVSHKNIGKNLDRLSATTPSGMLEVSSTVDQSLDCCLARDISEVGPDGDTLTRS